MEDKQRTLNPSAIEAPPYYRCPISMEVMQDPVTISTGVTFERANIEKWFFTYKKKTCPATMQSLDSFVLTPNLTLKRLILSMDIKDSFSIPPLPVVKCGEVETLLQNIESWPFKVSSLKKLRLIMAVNDGRVRSEFVQANGIEVLVKIVTQITLENSNFANFDACDEALAVLSQFPLSRSEKPFESLTKPESIAPMAAVMQRGSTEGRFYAITILQKLVKNGYDWNFIIKDQGADLFKPLLEIASDEMSAKASSSALEALMEIMESSKKSRLKSVEAGAVSVLIGLLPDSNRSKCEKILHALKLLCECAEGRSALVENAMGIAAVTKKMKNVSNLAAKMAVKILWLICSNHPNERVLEEMMACGSVRKLSDLLHVHGGSTQEKIVKILKLHRNLWRRFPCFTDKLRDYLQLSNRSS